MKPKLTPEKIVDKLKTEKGISFNYMTESQAIAYLREKNNYYRLASYRKNYDKRLNGANQGKYIDLDFACLVDLSTIDMHLRFLILKMCLDIEHDLKIAFLNDILKDAEEDGYSLIKGFLDKNAYLLDEIYRKRKSTYVGDLINKFFTFETHQSTVGNTVFDEIEIRCPVWAFVEIISFGSFIKLYDYYYGHNAPVPRPLLTPVQSLRNACAHNNCIINNLRSGLTRPGRIINQYIAPIGEISKDSRKKYLSVRPIFEWVNLMCVYDKIVSKDVKTHRFSELKDLVYNRMTRHREYYERQQLLQSAYDFIKKVVDFIA